MLTQDEIMEIIEIYADIDGFVDIDAAAEAIAARLAQPAGLDEINRMIDADYDVIISKRSDDLPMVCVRDQQGRIVSAGCRTGSLLGSLMDAYAGTPEATERLVDGLREVME